MATRAAFPLLKTGFRGLNKFKAVAIDGYRRLIDRMFQGSTWCTTLYPAEELVSMSTELIWFQIRSPDKTSVSAGSRFLKPCRKDRWLAASSRRNAPKYSSILAVGGNPHTSMDMTPSKTLRWG